MPPPIALAYASVLKGPRAPAPLYEPRWTVWGGAYGGSNRTSGDVAIIGRHDLSRRRGVSARVRTPPAPGGCVFSPAPHDLSARTVGLAGGFDYRLTPDTVVGL